MYSFPMIYGVVFVYLIFNHVIYHPCCGEDNSFISKKSSINMVPDNDDEDYNPSYTQVKKVVNFASVTAGAVVLQSSPNSVGYSNLLSDDKDKYGISPCADKKWVVIGLSEDILVTSLVMSNYEKYSSKLHEFQILGSTSYPVHEWLDLGTYNASPKLGEQTFTLLQPSFARFIKIKFLTHYGEEFYCTLSQIKVHGSTVIENIKNEFELSDQKIKNLHSMMTLQDEMHQLSLNRHSTSNSNEFDNTTANDNNGVIGSGVLLSSDTAAAAAAISATEAPIGATSTPTTTGDDANQDEVSTNPALVSSTQSISTATTTTATITSENTCSVTSETKEGVPPTCTGTTPVGNNTIHTVTTSNEVMSATSIQSEDNLASLNDSSVAETNTQNKEIVNTNFESNQQELLINDTTEAISEPIPAVIANNNNNNNNTMESLTLKIFSNLSMEEPLEIFQTAVGAVIELMSPLIKGGTGASTSSSSSTTTTLVNTTVSANETLASESNLNDESEKLANSSATSVLLGNVTVLSEASYQSNQDKMNSEGGDDKVSSESSIARQDTEIRDTVSEDDKITDRKSIAILESSNHVSENKRNTNDLNSTSERSQLVDNYNNNNNSMNLLGVTGTPITSEESPLSTQNNNEVNISPSSATETRHSSTLINNKNNQINETVNELLPTLSPISEQSVETVTTVTTILDGTDSGQKTLDEVDASLITYSISSDVESSIDIKINLERNTTIITSNTLSQTESISNIPSTTNQISVTTHSDSKHLPLPLPPLSVSNVEIVVASDKKEAVIEGTLSNGSTGSQVEEKDSKIEVPPDISAINEVFPLTVDVLNSNSNSNNNSNNNGDLRSSISNNNNMIVNNDPESIPLENGIAGIASTNNYNSSSSTTVSSDSQPTTSLDAKDQLIGISSAVDVEVDQQYDVNDLQGGINSGELARNTGTTTTDTVLLSTNSTDLLTLGKDNETDVIISGDTEFQNISATRTPTDVNTVSSHDILMKEKAVSATESVGVVSDVELKSHTASTSPTLSSQIINNASDTTTPQPSVEYDTIVQLPNETSNITTLVSNTTLPPVSSSSSTSPDTISFSPEMNHLETVSTGSSTSNTINSVTATLEKGESASVSSTTSATTASVTNADSFDKSAASQSPKYDFTSADHDEILKDLKITGACLEALKFSEFQSKMMMKRQQGAEGGSSSSSGQDSVIRVLIQKITNLELNFAILEMYSVQVSDCYRMILHDLIEVTAAAALAKAKESAAQSLAAMLLSTASTHIHLHGRHNDTSNSTYREIGDDEDDTTIKSREGILKKDNNATLSSDKLLDDGGEGVNMDGERGGSSTPFLSSTPLSETREEEGTADEKSIWKLNRIYQYLKKEFSQQDLLLICLVCCGLSIISLFASFILCCCCLMMIRRSRR